MPRMRSILSAALAVAGSAMAAPDARALFQKGAAELAAGEDLKAVADFEAAYAAQPAPSLLYWLGEAHFQAGHSGKAEELFARYLKEMPDGPKVEAARGRLKELRPVKPAAKPRRRRMVTDEIALAPPPPKVAPPPAPAKAAAVAAPRPAPTAAATPVPVPAAVPAPVTPPNLAPVAASKPVPAAALPQVATAAPESGGGRRIGAWAAGGAAVAAGAAAGLFAFQAHRAAQDITAAAQQGQPFDPQKDQAGRRDQALALVFAGVAAAALAVSIALF